MGRRRYDYLRDPEAIYRASFAAIEAACDFGVLPKSLRGVAARLVHACGMEDIVADLAYSPEVALAARKALEDGAPVLVDAGMVDVGIARPLLPAANPVICTLHDPQAADLARRLGTTRSAAAVELWPPHLDGAVVAIGNAPTALFHLLERLEDWAAHPAAILAFPVGFIGAAESKEALIEAAPAPYLALRGRRGGSALAAAAVNALGGARP